MANKLYEETYIQAIADSIRGKTGKTDTMTVAEMSGEIDGIEAGSGSDLPVAEQSSFGGETTGGNKFYYNGVLLPEIPSDVLAEYPYCVIRNNTASGYYDAFFAEEMFYWQITGSSQGITQVDQSVQQPWYRIAIAESEQAENWELNKISSNTWFSFDDNRTLLWSNHDIYQATDSVPSLYFEATEPVPEVDDASWYQIKASTLTGFADEAIRIDGEVTAPITTAKIQEILENAKVNGTLDGLENGWDVMFYDENNEGLAFYSCRDGHSIPSPNYTCESWTTENGQTIIFPCIPTKDLIVYANNDTVLGRFYSFYGVDIMIYPYLIVGAVLTTDESIRKCFIGFGDEISSTSDRYITFKNMILSGYVAFDDNQLSIVSDANDYNQIQALIMDVIPTLDLTPTSEGSYWPGLYGSKNHVYSNFDATNLSSDYNYYRLDQ